MVDRIVGSNSKIGNFTILKFLFSHSRTKNLNSKLTIAINPFSTRSKIARTQKAIINETLASSWFHWICKLENCHAITNHARPQKTPYFLKKMRIVNLRWPILAIFKPASENSVVFQRPYRPECKQLRHIYRHKFDVCHNTVNDQH